MDGTSDGHTVNDMDMKESQNSHEHPESMSDATEAPELDGKTSRGPSNQDIHHGRGASVDVIAQEGTLSPKTGPISISLEDGNDATSTSAFLTPQSGMSSNSSTASSTSKTSANSPAPMAHSHGSPSIDDQITQVMSLATEPLREGQKGYVVANTWLSRVVSRGTQAKEGEYPKAAMEGDIGPVDNSGINLIMEPGSVRLEDEAGDPFIQLKPGVQISEDFEIIPQDAWELIIKWYGLAQGSPIITRYCHNTNTIGAMENLQYELNPPVFTILKLPDRVSAGVTSQSLKEKDLIPTKILASRRELFQKFLKRAKSSVGIDLKTKVRVWRILGGLGENPQPGMLTPAQSRSASPAQNVAAPTNPGKSLVLDVNAFVALQQGSQRELIDTKDESANEKYNGRSSLDLVGLSQDEVIVLEEQIGGPAGGEWVSDVAGSQATKHGVSISVTKDGFTTVQDSLKPRVNTSNGRVSPASSNGGMMTRGRAQKNGRTRGTIGLSNLGNTCYMNSALQCVRSVEELTTYFLQDQYQKELNPRNPLGHHGEVAKAYAGLLREIYSDSSYSSFSPRHFKQVIGKYGPSFSGYAQQDSQEFLLFLLDGLQEDLNRVLKKPYIEKPDSTDEMVHDPVALREMADKCWEIYKARNDSVITDLFAGMYKSTVVCPVCDKVSIIFDPFNNLTLQLPIENLWSRTLFFFPLHSRPIRVAVDIDKNASFLALKEYIAKKTNVDAQKTVVAEIYKHRFFKMFSDSASISDERIADGDVIAIFELEDIPSNYPPPKKKVQKPKTMLLYHQSDDEEDLPEGESPLAEKMLVGVFNRVIKDGPSRFQQKALFGVPSYIIVTREEAQDYEAILRKVLAKVATMTTMDILRDGDGPDDEFLPQESDAVYMTAEDADSSSDLKVQAQSVQSEDGMVDITMQDAGEGSQATPHMSFPPQSRKANRVPCMLRPGEFLVPEVRNLFEMKYFSGTEMIPTGWSALQDENKNYPSLASRVPQQTRQLKRSTREVQKRRMPSNGSSMSSDEDADNILPEIHNSVSLDPDGSSSDDFPEVEELTKAINGNTSRSIGRTQRTSSGLIKYSHQGKRFRNNGGDEESESPIEKNNAPLIRLGEAIILDWNLRNHDALFQASEGTEETDMRGAPTWEQIPTLPDPELEKKRQLRSSRKRNGVSLGDCLDEFGKSEILSQNDAWYCPRCKEHRRASKTFELWKSPDILVIHLKRFSAQGRLRDKLDVHVDFPVEGLDLSSRVAIQEEGKSPIYDLFAVDNHYGGLGGGHYTAFAQNFFDENWYEYNDSQASRRSNPQAVVTSAAYLLFYRRRSSKVLGGPFFEQNFPAINDPISTNDPLQPSPRAESPSSLAGEGKRLDDFSRNGSSSASQEAEAVHQAGDGGLVGGTLMGPRNESERSELPGYSQRLLEGEQSLGMMDSMELAPSSIDHQQKHGHNISDAHVANWNFASLSERDTSHDNGNASDDGGLDHQARSTKAPPGSEGDMEGGIEEDLFEDASTRAVSSTGASVDGEQRSLKDFADEEEDWPPSPRYGTPTGEGDGQLHIGPESGEDPPTIVMREPRWDLVKGEWNAEWPRSSSGDSLHDEDTIPDA